MGLLSGERLQAKIGPWVGKASCREKKFDMYPESSDPKVSRHVYEALLVCDGCEVRRDCLRFAVETREIFGVWGGSTEFQRRRLIRDADTQGVDRVVKGWEVDYRKRVDEMVARTKGDTERQRRILLAKKRNEAKRQFNKARREAVESDRKVDN